MWTVSWKRPFPPRFVAQIGFYFLNLPWLTQDPGVVLEGLERGAHPVAPEQEYLRVAMNFEPDRERISNSAYEASEHFSKRFPDDLV